MTKKTIFFIIIICFLLLVGGIFALIFFHEKNLKDTNKTVNIVFITDKNYKDYLKTTMRSAIANKNEDSVYNINILCVDLPENERNKYKKFESKNVHINPMAVSLNDIKDVGNYDIFYFVTRADLFKFFMPDLFPKLDKILAIDVDTVILKDLTQLYNTDLKDKYIGVVNKPKKDFSAIHINNKVVSSEVRKYNNGVMLYNLKLWRKDDITNELIKEKNQMQDKSLMTQNVFNYVLDQKKIKKLPPIYNVFSRWDDPAMKQHYFLTAYFPYCWLHSCSFEALKKDAVIIHYLDIFKPWVYRDEGISKYWLLYERKEDYK